MISTVIQYHHNMEKVFYKIDVDCEFGVNIDTVCELMADMAVRYNTRVRTYFNTVPLMATPGTTKQDLFDQYNSQINKT